MVCCPGQAEVLRRADHSSIGNEKLHIYIYITVCIEYMNAKPVYLKLLNIFGNQFLKE
jgi:hypothetical protein